MACQIARYTRYRSFITFKRTPFELESHGAARPALLCHVAFQFLGYLLELAQYIDLVFERIESPVGKVSISVVGIKLKVNRFERTSRHQCSFSLLVPRVRLH